MNTVAGAAAAIETAAANLPAITAAPGHAATASAAAETATERANAATGSAGQAAIYAQLLNGLTDDYGFVGTAPDSTDDYGSL